ncbi:tabinhibitin 7-like isoform X1 [Drosophila takahashii]|uniref:tabinhibitin 7-like isoform X1 n=1 Tax=Drosophila takahashii TaxID=29030 RepID=UPI0038995067
MSSSVLLISLLMGCIVGFVAFQIDHKVYCSLPYCGNNNIVCQKANYSFLCRRSTRLVDLDSKQKDTLLHTVNEFRNRAAQGLTRTLHAAGKMARILWSSELEYFARMDVMSCMPTPRPCMTSPNFPNMGSIFDTDGYMGPKLQSFGRMMNMITKWTKEGRYVTRQQTVFLTDRRDQRSVFRPALLMADRNTHMGCAAVKFSYQRFNYLYMSCTFATVNILEAPIYRVAQKPGIFCKERDEYYKNLCATTEEYPENKKYVELTKYMT